MSRVNDNGGFGEGWQKTSKRSYADSIHQQGNSTRQTQQAVEKARTSATEAAKATESVQQQNTKPVANTTEVAKPIVNNRVDTQSQSAVSQARSTAAEQCVAAKDNARILSQLTTKAQPTNNAEVVTRNAVVGSQQAPQADVGRNLSQQPNLAANLTQAAQNAAGRRSISENATRPQPKTAERNEQAPETQKNPQALEQGATVKTPVLANNAAKLVDAKQDAGEVSTASSDVDGEENRAEEEDQAPGSSRFAHGPTAGRSASKELGSLLGGSTGNDEGQQEQGDASAAVAVGERVALPETDPNFQVFSEFASDDPRVEFIKSRAQVYTRFVEKKLEKIAQLDSDLNGKIQQMFETTPLSQRIMGENADAIKATDFLRSVYGGLIA